MTTDISAHAPAPAAARVCAGREGGPSVSTPSRRRASRIVLVIVLVSLLASEVAWFLSEGVALPVLLAIVPILVSAHTMLGGILWLVLAGDDLDGSDRSGFGRKDATAPWN